MNRFETSLWFKSYNQVYIVFLKETSDCVFQKRCLYVPDVIDMLTFVFAEETSVCFKYYSGRRGELLAVSPSFVVKNPNSPEKVSISHMYQVKSSLLTPCYAFVYRRLT